MDKLITAAESRILVAEDIKKIAGVEHELRSAFWGWYLDPTSPTLMDAYSSAIRAGFPEDQAKVVKQYKWFKSSTLKAEIYSSAEGVLGQMLKMSELTEKTLKDGSVITVTDPALVKIKQDTAKFIASTLGKKDYSQRTELSGKNGGAIETKSVTIDDNQFEAIINAYASRRNAKSTKDSSTEDSISE